jgi:hypothetical protein
MTDRSQVSCALALIMLCASNNLKLVVCVRVSEIPFLGIVSKLRNTRNSVMF